MKTAHATHHARRNSHDGESPFAQDIEGLKDGVSQLRSDVSELAQTAMHAGHTGTAAVQDLAGKAVEGVTDMVNERVASLKKSSQRTLKTVTGQIAEYPVASTLIALGVGYILAKFMSRK